MRGAAFQRKSTGSRSIRLPSAPFTEIDSGVVHSLEKAFEADACSEPPRTYVNLTEGSLCFATTSRVADERLGSE
jgi:hypothetical protein